MLTLTLCTTFLIALLAGGAPAQRRLTPIRLLATGEFHGEEVTAKSGERWLGLFPNGGGTELRPATLKVEAVHDLVIDEEHEKTGKKVSVGQAQEPLLLLKGAGAWPRGRVATVSMERRRLGNAADLNFALGGKSYRLRVVSDDPTPSELLKRNSRLLLTFEGTSQVLSTVQEPLEGGWSLLWAGDLDGDGRLDLYMDLSRQDNVSRRTLFLSTRARKGRLVREVAEFVTSGC